MKLDLSNPIDRQKAQTYFEKLIEKKAKIELKEFRAKRTIQQNKYLHVVLGYVADYTGFTIEEAKVVMKREFGSFMVYEKQGVKLLESTSKIDKYQMTIFIDFIREKANENGVYIPTAKEYLQHQFEVEKELQHVM